MSLQGWVYTITMILIIAATVAYYNGAFDGFTESPETPTTETAPTP